MLVVRNKRILKGGLTGGLASFSRLFAYFVIRGMYYYIKYKQGVYAGVGFGSEIEARSRIRRREKDNERNETTKRRTI
jgi:hypothetical protein